MSPVATSPPERVLTRRLREAVATDELVRAWAPHLPARIGQAAARWELDLGTAFEPGGHTAWVAPATTASGADVVLKVGLAHAEGAHEGTGLRHWDGDGAVRLLDEARLGEPDGPADTAALLLERCTPGTTLSTRPEPEQDDVIAGLLRRLWRPAHTAGPDVGAVTTLVAMCDTWADHFEARAHERPPPIDPGLARTGMALLRELPRTADRQALLVTDLHAENVLAATREPWLVIDPKPHVGDPTYDILQHLLNCPGRLQADPLGLCDSMARRCDLDPTRARRWLFARCVQESPHWAGPVDLADIARRIAP
jgi:streptomycin 6-kinase